MYNYICKECGGRCDAGEMVNDVCPECLEERVLANIKQDNLAKLLNAPYKQMRLELCVNRKENEVGTRW